MKIELSKDEINILIVGLIDLQMNIFFTQEKLFEMNKLQKKLQKNLYKYETNKKPN